jgi:hydroxymethylpyrimidine/phosphomethylpyrimidine kinase
MSDRPYALTIAGFDPSQGAGVGADLKTFEQHGVQGLGVCTAVTVQHESQFVDVEWMHPERIFQQFDILVGQYDFQFVKIGLIQNFEVLEWLISRMLEIRPELKIIWDPILKATAGFEFHGDTGGADIKKKRRFKTWLKSIHLITPNAEEAMKLAGTKTVAEAAEFFSPLCNTWIKSASETSKKIEDHLLIDGKKHVLSSSKLSTDKHGTGCVLSAATAASLANGQSLEKAAANAHNYLQAYLESADGLLGQHAHLKTPTKG